MSGAALVADLRARGVTLLSAGDRIGFVPMALVTDADRVALAANRDEVLAIVRNDARSDWTPDDWKAHFDERASIIEFDGNLPRPEAERLAFIALAVEWHATQPDLAGVGSSTVWPLARAALVEFGIACPATLVAS